MIPTSLEDLSRTVVQSTVLLPSLIGFVSVYHFFAATKPLTPKQRSWVLTTVASAIVTLASLPFVWDYIRSRGDVAQVRHSPNLAYITSRLFQGYLISDISMGLLYYREQVGLLTGWVHHSIYILVVEVAIRRSWAHIFTLCGVMELPTFLLSIGSLNPVFRSNITFALAFFSTRIILHLVLLVSYFLPGGRMQATQGSFVPAAVLTFIFPMHAMWFSGCVKGFIKRHQANRRHGAVSAGAAATATATVPEPAVSVSAEPQHAPVSATPTIPVELQKRSPRPAQEANKENVPPSGPSRPSRQTLPAKLVRRLSIDKALKKMEMDATRQRIREARRLLYEVLPQRERVYDYFGLGRGLQQFVVPNPVPQYERIPGLGGDAMASMVAVY